MRARKEATSEVTVMATQPTSPFSRLYQSVTLANVLILVKGHGGSRAREAEQDFTWAVQEAIQQRA